MSDVFGEMTELRTFGSNDWIIGSQLVDKIRDMAAPERFGDPSKMSAFVVTTQDHGGVHTNSGIINKSFYNLVKLIGAADAEKIFYRALSAHLVARSDFIDARLAAVQSAKEIFGANSNQATKTAEAFDAVEIFEQAPPPPEPEIPAVSGNDSTLFVYEQGGSKFIGRRETALNDPAIGVQLGSLTAAATRPSVSGDGTVAFYVTSARDACFLRTDGTQAESCIGASGRIASVAMSPDGKQYAFVLLDSAGQLTNTIRVINIATGSDRTYTLPAAVTEGASAGFVEFADTMEFTSTGDFLVYDAYTVTEYAGGYNAGAWSIYAIDLATAEVYPLFGPILGADIEYPAFSSRSDRYLAFDVQTSNTSYVFLSDLETASSNYVYSESGFIGIPSYSGDDSAFTYSFATNTPSGYSIARWNLANDRTTPSGQPSLWMDDANFGVIYRRGTYSGPTTQPGKMEFASATHVATEGSVLSVMVFRVSGSKGAASVHYRTTPGTATTPNDYFTTTGTLTWADGDEDPKFIKINIAADQLTENNETFTVSLDSPVGGTIGSRPTSTITIKNMAPPPQGRKRPVGRR